MHSVVLNPKLCKGCVNCIKHCPTEAIRIRSGKAIIIEEKCIDCGECIRHCPSHAQLVTTDTLAEFKNYKVNIAIVPPALYAQFPPDLPLEEIIQGCLNIGFTDVYDMSRSYEYVSLAIEKYLTETANLRKPLISTHCPVVTRLIQMKFPELIKQLLPLMPVVEIAAIQARAKFTQELNLRAEDIGIWFISSCPAMVTMAKECKNEINGVISVAKIYGEILKILSDCKQTKEKVTSSSYGWGCCVAGGSVRATGIVNSLVVDGIHDVFDVLEQVSINKMPDVDYIECSSCAGGCVGGVLNAENKFVAEKNIKLKIRHQRDTEEKKRELVLKSSIKQEKLSVDINKYENLQAKTVMKLDENIILAMKKLQDIEKILSELPGLDCGSCGAPSCQSLAEDIVQGKACESDCVFKLRTRVETLAGEMKELSNKINVNKG